MSAITSGGRRVTHRRRVTCGWRAFVRDTSGQSLIEGAVVLPLLLLVALGVIDVGVALRDQHAVIWLGREGSNLTSRDTTLRDAASALQAMRTEPLDFGRNAKVVLSVIKRGGTVGTTNYNRLILYQRHEFGSYAATSRLRTRGAGAFGPAPDYIAHDSDSNAALQITNAPAGLVSVPGGMTYVTEVFHHHDVLTPIGRFGVHIPTELYSVTYF